ncbi:MAG TPA: zf-HC2 domain-containing protein, partial [Isosphaeraceae bacterium]|nr:zf-HC2 domain-containing protein [Isosphaeraceae bacterium]
MNAESPPHPTDQLLCSYGLGKLDDSSASAVSQHLERCAECRQRVGAISSDSFLGRLQKAREVDPPLVEGASL